MKTETLDDLLTRDIDDLMALAVDLRPDARSAMLAAAAERLSSPALPFRMKLIGFVQALASLPNGMHADPAEHIAAALITAAHADDPAERLAALRALALVALHTQHRNVALAHSMLATFEHARIDSSSEIRAFAGEIRSPENPVFRRLIAIETDMAGAGEMPMFLEAVLALKNDA
jgi:hypothetical protein